MPISPRSSRVPASVRRASHWAVAGPRAAALSARRRPRCIKLQRRPLLEFQFLRSQNLQPPFLGLNSGLLCRCAAVTWTAPPARATGPRRERCAAILNSASPVLTSRYFDFPDLGSLLYLSRSSRRRPPVLLS